MPEIRSDGYYWTRMGREWLCCRWSNANNGYWTIPMVDTPLKDSHFDEINKTRIVPPDELNINPAINYDAADEKPRIERSVEIRKFASEEEVRNMYFPRVVK
jgi:hypothetical protein